MRLKGRGPAWAAYRAALRETRCMEPGCRQKGRRVELRVDEEGTT